MKKFLTIILSLCLLLCIVPSGVISVNADVCDYEISEKEPNDTMNSANRIHNDYTVSGVATEHDMDYYEFTLPSTSLVEIITAADYSCFEGGIIDSSGKAIAVSEFVKYSSYGDSMYLTSVVLEPGTYYYLIFNKPGSTLNNTYMFYFIYESHTHLYDDCCDTSCNTCGSTRTAPHDYYIAKTITKATTSKNGSVIKKCKICNNTVNSAVNYAKKVKLSTTTYTYNGKVKKPSVSVYDSQGKKISSSNYTVKYDSGRKKVGTYTVKVTLKGNYSGTLSTTFKINPAKTSLKKLTAAKKSLKVTINKKSGQTTGYQIQYSTSKSFKEKYTKTKTVSSYKTTSVTIKSLKAKKTYYIRVRTYKTVNGKKYYSSWSSAKSKKTK